MTRVKHSYCRKCKRLYMREYRSYDPTVPHSCPACKTPHRSRHTYCPICLAKERQRYREIERARA